MKKMTAVPEAFQAAAAAYSQGRLDEAGRLLTAFCAQSPQDASALYLLSLVHIGLSEWPQAIDRAREVIAFDARENIPRKFGAAAITLFAATRKASGNAENKAEQYEAVRPVLLEALEHARTSWKAARELFYSAMLAILAVGDAETGMQWLNLLYPGAKGLPGRGVISLSCTTRAYCAGSGIAFTEVAGKQKIRVANGTIAREYETNPFTISVIPGAEALCGWDFIVAPTGEVLSDSGYTPIENPQATWFPHAGVAEMPKILHLWPKHCEYIDADVIFLHAPARLHFGHWLVDFIPRLRALEALSIPGIRICVPANIGPKHRELLVLAGVEKSQLIECTLGTRYKFRRMIVIQSGDYIRPSIEYLAYLSRIFLPALPPLQRPRRIFVIRAVATRKIINADELRVLLNRYGFEYMDIAATSIAAQREAFAEAELVICTYGSDLLSMFFMLPGCDLVEFIYDATITEIGEEAMSAYLRINMHPLLCSVSGVNDGPRHKKDADFVVDCYALQNLLDTILNRKAAGITFQVPLEFCVLH